MILDLDRARRVVDEVETRLWTPMGPRSLAPDDWRYVARYQGGRERRDGGYHQGTVWPWLAGAFVEAWVRTRQDEIGNTQRVARERFLKPLMDYAEGPGMGHICEIADGEAPHAARGCPFQAWSVGEALRLSLKVLASEQATQPEAESLS